MNVHGNAFTPPGRTIPKLKDLLTPEKQQRRTKVDAGTATKIRNTIREALGQDQFNEMQVTDFVEKMNKVVQRNVLWWQRIEGFSGRSVSHLNILLKPYNLEIRLKVNQ